MYFKLVNGKAVFALAKATITKERKDFDGEGKRITVTEEQETFIYDAETLSQYPDAELIDQPTPEVLSRAAQIEGRTLSKSEFERMLFEKSPLEQMQETIDMLVLDSLGGM